MKLTTPLDPSISTGMFQQLVAGVGAGSVMSTPSRNASLIPDVRSMLAGNAPHC